jgi:hypothetical protein
MPLLTPQDIQMLRQRIQQTIQTIFLAGAAWLLLVGGISPTIVVRGDKQAISRAIYNSLQVGDCVRLEIAPRSRTFLSLQKISTSSLP